MNIVWSPLSMQRIREIADYIAANNMRAANRWIDAVFKKVGTLTTHPETGRVVPEIGKTDIRELIFGNYRIIYLYTKRQVSILTVRHGKQILPTSEVDNYNFKTDKKYYHS